MAVISKAARLKVFIGSLFLQSSWSYARMQGLGFAAAISPAIMDVFKDKQSRIAALRRHLVFYNLHPYLASPVLGAAIALEREGRGEEAVELKESVMGPYGAIGDTFFWSSLRPLASAIGVGTALFFGFWALAVFLIFYNAFHIWMRWMGLKKGLELGLEVVEYIGALQLPVCAMRARYLLAAVLGVVAVLIVSGLAQGTMEQGVARVLGGAVAAVSAVAILGVFLKRGFAVTSLFYIVTLPIVLYGFLTQV